MSPPPGISPRVGYLLSIPWGLNEVGGVNQVVKNLYDEIARIPGHRPIVLVGDWNSPRLSERRIEGRETVYLRQPVILDGGHDGKTMLAYCLRLPFTLSNLHRLARKYGIGCVNIHYPNLGALNWIILRKLGLFKGRLLLSIHGLDIRTAMKHKGLRGLAWRMALRGADKIVSCSGVLGDEVLRHYRMDPRRVAKIYNGVDAARLEGELDGFRNETEIFMRRRYIVNIGTFEHKKGHDLLLKAFKIVSQKNPEWDLVMVGRPGETSEGIRRMVEELFLGARVFMLENLPHGRTLNILRHAEFFVLPSRNEAFAIVLLESGACGKGVVATDICGVRELIEHGISGLVVPPEDVESLAEAISAFISDEQLRTDCARRLKENVLTNFSWSRACREYLEIAYPESANGNGEAASFP